MSDLVLDKVTVRRRGRMVLDAIDARFAAGRLTVVIGPNGAGKSTLLAVAAGLLKPDGGGVLLGTRPLGKIGRMELARRRAYLPQNPAVDWPISVERVVALGLTAHLPAFGGLPDALRSRIAAALSAHDLAGLRDRPATELSGGELARAMLARATVGDPELLIADEPTAGLDPRHAIDAARRLRALADAGRTVVVALHDLDLAMRIADDALAIRDGAIAAAGTAAEVFTPAVFGALYDVPAIIGPGGTIRFGAPEGPSATMI